MNASKAARSLAFMALLHCLTVQSQAQDRVVAELDKTTIVDFNNQQLGDVLSYLSDAHSIRFILVAKDKAPTRITYAANTKLRDVLTGILKPLKLDFEVKDDTIEIDVAKSAK